VTSPSHRPPEGAAPRATPIDSLDDPRLDDFRNVRDPDLRRERGLFVVEGRKNVEALVRFGRFETKAVLVTRAALDALAPVWSRLASDCELYLAEPRLLDAVVGYRVHRGCLAVGYRRDALPLGALVDAIRALPEDAPQLVVALEDLTDIDNVGSLFRNALALAATGVVLSPRCCDPLYRKAVRVSMGAVLRLPYARATSWPEDLDLLRAEGFEIIALDPGEGSLELAEFAVRSRARRRVVVVGSEGDGLGDALLRHADARVRIAMAPDVDSLNVATAAAIAMHALGPNAHTRASA